MLKSKNIKVCILQTSIYFGYEKSIFLLENELKKKFSEIKYVLFSNKVFENYKKIFTKKKIYKYFPSTFPAFREKFKKEDEFKKRSIFWCYSWNDIKKQISDADIVIAGSNRNNELLVKFCKENSIFLVIQKNPASLDPDTNILPDLYLLNNKDFYNRLIKFKYFSKSDYKKKIKVTGSLQYLYILRSKKLNPNYFYKKYKLKKTKKIIIFFGEGPQYFDEKYLKSMKEIKNIFKKSNFQLLYKPHPSEYANRKNIHKRNIHKLSFKKDLPICSEEDYPTALKLSSGGMSFLGSISYELNLFKKPIIYVDRLRWYYEEANQWSTKNLKYIPRASTNYNTKLNLHSFKEILKDGKHNQLKKETIWYSQSASEMYKAFFGLDTSIENLGSTLNYLNKINFTEKKIFKLCQKVGHINGNLDKKIVDLIEKNYINYKDNISIKFLRFLFFKFYFLLRSLFIGLKRRINT